MSIYVSSMLFQAPELSDQEEGVLSLVETLRAQLRRFTREPARWVGSLRRVQFARAIQGSNSIEGYHVTLDDALAAVDGEEPMSAEEESWRAVSNYQTAMTYVLQLARDPHFELSAQLLKSLHFMMLSHELKKDPGQWRTRRVQVRDDSTGRVVYDAPDPDLVHELMDALIDSLRPSTTPTLVEAAMAHLNLVMVHPFRDGNGRMGRALQTLVLAREGVLTPEFISIEEYLGRNTPEYYRVLGEVGAGRWNPDRSARPWVRFILKAHHQQATTLLRRVKETARLWEELETVVEHAGVPERSIPVLFNAARGQRIRNTGYRLHADVSAHTAGRDLKQLVEAGLLEPHGERRGRFYVGTDSLRRVRNEIRIAREEEYVDPFA